MDNVEEIDKKFNEKKNGTKAIIIFVLLIIIAIGAAAGYFILNSKPKAIMKNFVNKVSNKNNVEKIENIDMDVSLSAKLDSDDAQTKLAFKELSKCILKIGTQFNIKDKQETIEFGLDYDNKDVIDAQVILDKENAYAYFDGIYDKYIKVDIGEDALKELNKSMELMGNENIKAYNEETIDILKTVLNEKIDKSEDITQENTTIKISDKEKKVKVSTIKLSSEEFINVMSDFYLKLSEAKMYENDENAKESIKKAADELKKLTVNKEDYIKISIYTEGIDNKFAGLNFTIYVKEQDVNLNMELLKSSSNSYEYMISGDTKGANITIATGEIKIEEEINNKEEQKEKIIITAEIPATITGDSKISAEITIDTHTKINSQIEKIDTTNSVNIEEITQEEIISMVEKLQKRPLIGDIITSLMNTSILNNTSDLVENTQKGNTDSL